MSSYFHRSGGRVLYCMLCIENISPRESYDYCTITPPLPAVTNALLAVFTFVHSRKYFAIFKSYRVTAGVMCTE